jgi:MraZ protein
VSKSGNKWINLVLSGFSRSGEWSFLVFRGVQHINMDAKGRLAMPARQREPLLSHCDGQIVATIDTQSRCLVIYPLPEWERIEGDIQALPALNPAVKRFQRLMLGYATDLELDGNGRMLLPPPLREYAQLDKKLVLVGQGNKLELWSEQLWLAERDQALADSSIEADLPPELLNLTL